MIQNCSVGVGGDGGAATGFSGALRRFWLNHSTTCGSKALLRREHIRPVPGCLVLDELVRGIPRPAERPPHLLDHAIVALARSGEDRQPGRVAQIETRRCVDATAQENHGLHLRMIARELDRLVDAAARARRADALLVHVGLRRQPRERRFHVSRPVEVNRRLLLLALGEPRPAALAKAAEVEREDVKALSGEVSGERRPRRSIFVAGMEQDDRRTRTRRREIRRLERHAGS